MGDEDKSFEASQQKLQRLRESGQIIKSRDLSSALFLAIMFILLLALSPFVFRTVADMFVVFFNLIPQQHLEDMGKSFLILHSIKGLLLPTLPFLALAYFIAFFADFLQVGPLFALKSITPKLDKLNPINGLKGIFSKRTVVELFKNLLKIGILFYLGYTSFMKHLPEMINSMQSDQPLIILYLVGKILQDFIFVAIVFFIIIGFGDYLYQRTKFMNDQKMSLKEVKDEYKQSEGDPMVKHMLKQKRMQMMMQRQLEAVPTADVITTNPIHVAVALKYKPKEMEAPLVVAKGAEHFAERIKAMAREHNIPIVENPVLARTLYRVVDVNQDIPPDLYQAVAEILMFAWQMKGDSPLQKAQDALPTSNP
ncbi:MAG: flagellar biosynthesis protein FlhB [Vampirovibrio sp.]